MSFSSLTDSTASAGLNPVKTACLITKAIGSGNARIISFTLESMTSKVRSGLKNLCSDCTELVLSPP